MLRGYNGSDVFMIPPPTEPRTSLCEIYHSNTNIDSQSHLPATWLLRIYNIRYIRLIVSMRPCVYMSTGPCHVSLCPRVHFMCLYVHESMSCVFISMSPFHMSLCPRVHVMCFYVHGSIICVFMSTSPCYLSKYMSTSPFHVSICP